MKRTSPSLIINQDLLDELMEQTHLLKHYKEMIDKNTIVSITDKNGFITYISEAFEKVSGYSKQEAVGQTHALFRHPDTPKEFYTDMWNTLKTVQKWDGEVKNRDKNRNAYWLRLHIEYNRDCKGNFIGYSATGHDITNKIHLETLTKELEYRVSTEVERNRLQTTQMLEQSRLAQMGEMISMIAHQWRQPLASISAISSVLTLDMMMDNYKKEFFEERLNAISDLAQHLSLTIDDFRSFFKEDKEKAQATWEMITEGSLGIIEPTLQTQNITVKRLYESNEVLYTYTNEIRQVLLNIFKNAEDIFLEKKIENAIIWVRSYQKKGMSCLSIEDNAGGISEELLIKIFDPYFSTKEKKDGTGLGLYMSKTIIEEHCKGNLSVHNTINGACFEIILPI
ncbi:MAG: PAS domain S-box protein [Sulfuricurvum sp.]|nr:PAS domain S-box protein [Sulfuricurvum sp.]MDD5386533.1 PAS domain S-box protein [Sulfuricurvum sp.]